MPDHSVTPKTGHAVATIDGTVVAETNSWTEIEGNVYFPPESVKKDEYFTGTDLSTYCPWKGDASYYTIDVNGKKLENAAWYYNKPYDKVTSVKDYVAFYKNKVNVTVD